MAAVLRDARGRFLPKLKAPRAVNDESFVDPFEKVNGATIDEMVELFEREGKLPFTAPDGKRTFLLRKGTSYKNLPVQILYTGPEEHVPAQYPGMPGYGPIGGHDKRELNIFLQGVGIVAYGHKQPTRVIAYAYLLMIAGGFKPENVACGHRLYSS